MRPRYSWPDPRRKPRPSDWGLGMTLCIAAVAGSGQAIMLLSDTRFSLGYTSGETLNKLSKVHQRWGVSIAGDDIGQASPVIEAVKRWVWDVKLPTRLEIENAFVTATHDALVKKIEAEVLSPYNLTINEFVTTAFRDLGPDAFADLRQQVAHAKLGCEFLVFGFDERERANLFHVKDRGVVDDHCRTGFWAIGSGDYAAISTLAFHDYNTHLDLPTAAYLICSAKFMAERADLGKTTMVGYMVPNGTVFRVDPEPVRILWDADGKPRLPEKLVDRMPEFYEQAGSRPARRPKRLAALTPKSPKHGRKRPPASRA